MLAWFCLGFVMHVTWATYKNHEFSLFFFMFLLYKAKSEHLLKMLRSGSTILWKFIEIWSKVDQKINEKLIRKLSKIRCDPECLLDASWDGFWSDFGSKMGAKTEPSWYQNLKNEGSKTMSKKWLQKCWFLKPSKPEIAKSTLKTFKKHSKMRAGGDDPRSA